MRITKLFFFLIIIFFSTHSLAQQGGRSGMPPPSITGKVIEVGTGTPMEFANIVLFNSEDSSQVTGTITNKEGIFLLERIPRGSYYIKISFIGFDPEIIDNVLIQKPGQIDIGEIVLTPHSYGTEDIIVSGQRSPISYEIDKKVIDVGSQLTAASGSAVDILENVPSVTVDIEGNVSLRGSSNFTVLIDGRPTVMDAADALQQIPASSIENIEIITNPSAKYDPEGTAGIINIVMKKSELAGISGIVELNGGLNNQYGAEGIFDYKKNDIHLNFSANYNRRIFEMDEQEENWTLRNDVFSYYDGTGDGNRGWNGLRLSGSIAYDFGLGNIITFGGRYSDRTFQGNSNLNYSEWTSNEPNKLFYFSKSERERGGVDFTIFSNYIHKFNNNGHQVTADFSFESETNDEFTLNSLKEGNQIINGQRTTESGPEKEIRGKVDYTLPFSEFSKFEAGFQTEIELSTERTSLSLYESTFEDYIEQPEFNNETNYDEITHAIYSLYSNKLGRLGFQAGARAEYTGRQIELVRTGQDFNIDTWDFFPSTHFSYEFLDKHQLMASYTRRINRPRGWELEPFLTWMDAYNVRIGNPALDPEYIDSYELGYQTFIGNTVVSVEGYYRVVNNKIENVRSVYDDGITLNSVENVGKDFSLGTELFVNFDPIKNWNINLIGNLYDYKIEGQLNGQDFSRNSFNWNVRFNNSIKLSERTMFQINAIYNSPSVSSQGRREDFLFANVAVRYEIFENLLTATLQIRDVLNTAKREFVLETPELYSYRYGSRSNPHVMLNLRFNFNNYKQERRPDNGEGDGMSGEEF
ncbi:MAG: TonB-dependent receptor family protein [Melioribacteraceae bacterium]|jgi:outer membrane cobalamin receptor|nr:TonB-dependent receptor family protein [Melioribacteraceae bacterium]